MRQVECFGLTVDRVDFLRRTVRVDRQLVTVNRRPPFLSPPKTLASVRTVPLPQVVVDVLAAHLAAFPAPAEGLVFVTDAGPPIGPSAFGGMCGELPPRRQAHPLAPGFTSCGTFTRRC